jgi:DNA-binding transcriptional MocR family regulator
MPPPLAAAAGGRAGTGSTVITIGTMSKAAWGGLRIGWIRATARMVRELAALRANVDMAGPILDQLVAIELLRDWDAVLASRRALLRPRRDALFSALAEHAPGWTVRRPHGSISMWARIPTPDATRLAAAAAREGIAITPGTAFSVDGTFEHHIRLPFTLPPDDLRGAIERLSQLATDLSRADCPTTPEPSLTTAV